MLKLNEIHQGCCLDLMRHIPAGSVDMILCDLPYGTTQNKWDSVIPFDKLWAAYERIIKPNGAIVLTASQPFTSALVMSNPKGFKYEIVWDKKSVTGFLDASRKPLKAHESVLIFYNKQPTYNPIKTSANKHREFTNEKKRKIQTDNYGEMGDKLVVNYKANERFPTSVLTINAVVNNSNEKVGHPTQKPTALFEYLIKTYTNPGEVVLDNCAGSFTTAVAAENTGRRWICIEQEAKYCEIGRARLAARQPLLFAA